MATAKVTRLQDFWKHYNRSISFTLIIDDFGVNYVGKENADHLINILKEHYEVAEDWEGTKYCGITMDWDYIKRQVYLSMPGYCYEAPIRFCQNLCKIMDQPHKHALLVYRAKIQYAKSEDKSAKLGKVDKLFIQQVTGTFFYYTRAVDGTMIVALSVIASDQAFPSKETMRKTKKFLRLCSSVSRCHSHIQRKQYSTRRT